MSVCPLHNIIYYDTALAPVIASMVPWKRSATKNVALAGMVVLSRTRLTIVSCCSDAARSLHGAVLDSSSGLGVRPGLITEHKSVHT